MTNLEWIRSVQGKIETQNEPTGRYIRLRVPPDYDVRAQVPDGVPFADGRDAAIAACVESIGAAIRARSEAASGASRAPKK